LQPESFSDAEVLSEHAVSIRHSCSTVLSAAVCVPTAVRIPVPVKLVAGRSGHEVGGVVITGGGQLGGGGVPGLQLLGGTYVISQLRLSGFGQMT